MRVRGGEDRVAGVVDPRLPEEEALLVLARRVVGGRVQQPVDDAERARQVGRRRRQVAHRRAQLLDRRQRRARERPDLVAMIGVDSRRNGRVCRSDGPSARAAGRSDLERRPEHVRPSSRPCPASSWVVSSVPGSRCRIAAQRRVLLGQRLEHRVRVLHEVRELRVAPAELVGQQREVVHDAREVAAALGQPLVDLARVLRGRLQPPDRLRQLAALALGAEALGAVVEQQQQVVARVDVQRGQDLVEVDVGQRLGDRDHAALLELPGVLGARRQLGHHVLQAGLRAQQDRRVLVDPVVLAAGSSCR